MSNEKLEAVIADMRETFQNTHYLIPVGKLVERAFRAGIEQEEPAGDWHNLTEAIADGEPIDWEKLDGRKVRITIGQASAESKIYRNEEYLADRPTGWYCMFSDAFRNAWGGKAGWTLWLDGEIPMKKQTADALPFGTHFKGNGLDKYVKVANNMVQRLNGNGDFVLASRVEVVEVLGMYGQKESE